jgi:tetratricopeptide (TPR) repeat protein
LKRADAEFRWFVRTYSKRSDEDKDVKDPDELLLVGLAASENARWHKLSDQFRFILTEVYGEALKVEKEFWPAEFYAGMLLLEKYNRGEADAAFDKALTINPQAAEALTGKGAASLQRLEYKEAEKFAQEALRINPRLPAALRLAADVALAEGDIDTARKKLEAARQVNPRDEATLGRIAACLVVQRQQPAFETLVKEVEQHNPKAGVFHLELAERLEERRRFDLAETYFKKAADLMPVLFTAQNGLGLLYMRLGREKEAKEVLTRAFQADSFNVRVSNTLKVLRHLETYETLKTDHFEIRFDPKHDRPLARYMAPYLEKIYAELAEQFHYRPPGPILFEVFNNHTMFSGRIVALPDLHTIGACTGRMIAMVSPHGRGVQAPFNWARVLRHELVHIFNLEQTNFQVPHWLTEGLAVSNEGFPRPATWNQLLVKRVAANDLLDLDTINLGFIRPRSAVEWNLAYCQSQLYVAYLKERFGPQVVGELLAAYAEGLDTPAALRKVCKVGKANVEKGYRAYLDEVVKPLKGRAADEALSLKELEAAHEKMPDDADVAARLAERYLQLRRNARARKLADDVLAAKEGHPLAAYVKAKLLLNAGAEEEARTLLELAAKGTAPEPKALQALGEMAFENKDFTKAAEIFELAHKAQPYESKWLTKLASVYAQTGAKEKQAAVLKELAPTDADNLDVRKRLATLLLEAGKPAEAEGYATQALEIDVLDKEARNLLLKALRAQDKADEVKRVRTLLEK